MAAEQKGAAAAATPLVKAVVAAGRTVTADGKSYGPGATVELPASEIKRLQELGFITGPANGAAEAVASRPAIVRPS